MSHQTNRFRRVPRFGAGTEPPLFETGDYTIPDPLESRLAPLDDLALLPVGDFEDNESTTITRHRLR
jgi:hypothetical protein